ncbi:NLGNX-like protein, partial [Mya arenaria]
FGPQHVQCQQRQQHLIETNLGNISGTIQEVTLYNENGSTSVAAFVEYLGVPYAEPPIGEFRFRKPEPKKPWWGETHNGAYFRPSCYHSDQGTQGWFDVIDETMSEDCLTLNIYAPYISGGSRLSPLPVIVYIHTTPGQSSGFVGDVLSTEGDVIVVVINFRQGLLGFLSLHGDASTGNYGLWDQHMAINWVSDYISDFGGDPSKVTVIGHSVGASHAILQAMYPGNKQYFQKVVALSGTPIRTEGGTSSIRPSSGNEFIDAIGCMKDSNTEISRCLRGKSIIEIANTLTSATFTFSPTIDGTFIKADPGDILSNMEDTSQFENERQTFAGKDLLLGINNMEGGIHIALMWSRLLNKDINSFQVNRTEFDKIVVPTAMKTIYGGNVSESILNTVSFQYSDVTRPENVDVIRHNIVDLSTDIDVAAPLIKTASIHSDFSQGSTYLFQFSEPLNYSNPLKPSWLEGANRADDIFFLFGFSERSLSRLKHAQGFVPTIDQRTLVKKNPSEAPYAVWPKFDASTLPYMDISQKQIVPRDHFREPYMTFWAKIVPGLLSSTSRNSEADDISETQICPREIGQWFQVDIHTAENIILSLSIGAACLLVAFLCVCSFSVAREGKPNSYSLKGNGRA